MSMVDAGGVEPVVVSGQGELLHHTRLKPHKQLSSSQKISKTIKSIRGTWLHGCNSCSLLRLACSDKLKQVKSKIKMRRSAKEKSSPEGQNWPLSLSNQTRTLRSLENWRIGFNGFSSTNKPGDGDHTLLPGNQHRSVHLEQFLSPDWILFSSVMRR